jgi:putative transposase
VDERRVFAQRHGGSLLQRPLSADPALLLLIRTNGEAVTGENGPMVPLHVQLTNSTLRRVIMRLHFPLEIMLVCVRGYAAYPLSLRNLEEMMAERGVLVDHATVHRWALKMLPVLAAVLRRRKLPVGSSWRVDETYVLVGGRWKYLYRAVDKLGQTVDFLLTAHRDVAAARRFFERAIDLHDVPASITIDKSGANTAAVRGLIDDSGAAIELRQSKYLNNLVEVRHEVACGSCSHFFQEVGSHPCHRVNLGV